MTYEVIEDKDQPGVFRAEAIDYDSEGECYVVEFYGHDSKARATEYADFMNVPKVCKNCGDNDFIPAEG